MSSALLAGKRVLLGVSGSIAAYKSAELCSRLGKLGAEVHAVLTPHAARFIGPPTLRALTRRPVLIDLFDEPESGRIAHIDLAQSADLVLVAPASANTIAKMANGLADDLLSTTLLAVPPATPLLVAPAMNTIMWEHPAVRANLAALAARGVRCVEPGSGVLACQDVGMGKLAAVDEIVRAAIESLTIARDLEGVRVLVTAGATREPIDPVRFLSNRSSGKMGYAIAAEAAMRGASVVVVSGFSTAPAPAGVEIIRVESAAEMYEACERRFPACDLFIAAAAVADYAPAEASPRKLKKPLNGPESEGLVLRLAETRHILQGMAAAKRPGQIVVGFAAETEALIANAMEKLRRRNLDLVAANDVTQAGAGFDADTNVVTLLWPDGGVEALPLLSKRDVARRLLSATRSLLGRPAESRAVDVPG